MGVDIVALNQVSYELHVFLTPKSLGDVTPEVDLENMMSWKEHEFYAGWTAVFGGKGESKQPFFCCWLFHKVQVISLETT